MFLFRPHINHGDKTVTTDFIIENACIMANGAATQLPVGLLNASVDQHIVSDRTLSAAGLVWIAGDDTAYAAPCILFADATIHEAAPNIALQNARIAIARKAAPAAAGDWRIHLSQDRAIIQTIKIPSRSPATEGSGRACAIIEAHGDFHPVASSVSTITAALFSKTTLYHHCTLHLLEPA